MCKHIDTIAEQISQDIIETQELFNKLNAQVKLEWIARLTLNIRKGWIKKKNELKELRTKLGTKKRKIPSKDIFKHFFEEGHKTSCQTLKDLLTLKPKLRGLITLCLQFRTMMNRTNQAIELRKWIDKADNCGIPIIKKFAQEMIAEQQEIQEAIDCQWNNGLAEGTVNRVKNIKRKMYGRAGFELLKRKIILAKCG